MSDNSTEVEIGDVLNTAYGRMEVVDIETDWDGCGWVETRLVDENGNLLEA